MRFPSKYAGECPHCKGTFGEGDMIEYQKDCFPICVGCAQDGLKPLPKGRSPQDCAGHAAPPDDRTLLAILAELKVQTALLRHIAALPPDLVTPREKAARDAQTKQAQIPNMPGLMDDPPF